MSTEFLNNLETKIPYDFNFLFSPARHKVPYGGRGGAKSRSVATCLIARSYERQHRIFCGREIQKSITDSVKKLLDDQIARMEVQNNFHSTRTDLINKVTGTNFLFYGLKHNAESIKSLEGITIAWIEEAQTVSRSSLNLFTPTIRGENSEIYYTFNPRYKNDPVYEDFILNDPPPNSIIKKINYDRNPWFPKVLKDEMLWLKNKDYEKYKHIWEGSIIKNVEAKIFHGYWEIGIPRDETQSDVILFGGDWGFSEDPATLIRFFIDWDERKIYITHEFYRVGVELDNLPGFWNKIPGSKKWKIIADRSRPETIAFMRKRGYNVVRCKGGPGSVEDGIEFLKTFTIIVHPHCKHTIDELSLYSYKIDKKTDEVLPIVEDKNNHCIAIGTKIKTNEGDKNIEDIKINDFVLTRKGYKKVLWSGMTGIDKKVYKIKTVLGKTLIATSDHKIFTERGFVKVNELNEGDYLFCINQHLEEDMELKTSPYYANTVEKFLQLTNIKKRFIAVDRVSTITEQRKKSKVYDITVEDQHEFFANDILVHNCIDALRYGAEPYMNRGTFFA